MKKYEKPETEIVEFGVGVFAEDITTISNAGVDDFDPGEGGEWEEFW